MPVSVAPDNVSPVIVVTVAPEAIDVEPSVGALNPDGAAAHEGIPDANVRMYPSVPAANLARVFEAEE